MDRAAGFYPEGCRFESYLGHQSKRAMKGSLKLLVSGIGFIISIMELTALLLLKSRLESWLAIIAFTSLVLIMILSFESYLYFLDEE